MARLYVSPDDARALLDHAVKEVGCDAAVRDLAKQPHAYGPLRRQERAVLGVLRVADDRSGHIRASEAVRAGRQAVIAAEQLRAHILRMPPGIPRPTEQQADAYVHALSHARTRLRYAQRRASRLQGERRAYPATAMLLRELRAATLALTPFEVQRAVQWLTAPQAALLRSAREVARDIALGR